MNLLIFSVFDYDSDKEHAVNSFAVRNGFKNTKIHVIQIFAVFLLVNMFYLGVTETLVEKYFYVLLLLINGINVFSSFGLQRVFFNQ